MSSHISDNDDHAPQARPDTYFTPPQPRAAAEPADEATRVTRAVTDTEPAARQERSGKSGWEVADSVTDGVESVFSGIGWFLLKVYGLAWIAAGLFILFALPHWAGLLLVAYGTYILFGGSWIYL